MNYTKEHGAQAEAEERAAVEYERQREDGREQNEPVELEADEIY